DAVDGQAHGLGLGVLDVRGRVVVVVGVGTGGEGVSGKAHGEREGLVSEVRGYLTLTASQSCAHRKKNLRSPSFFTIENSTKRLWQAYGRYPQVPDRPDE